MRFNKYVFRTNVHQPHTYHSEQSVLSNFLGVEASAFTKICQLGLVLLSNENVVRLYIACVEQ